MIEDQASRGAFPMNCSRLREPKLGPRVNSNNKSAREGPYQAYITFGEVAERLRDGSHGLEPTE